MIWVGRLLLFWLVAGSAAGLAAQQDPCPADRVCGTHLLNAATAEAAPYPDQPPAGFALSEPGIYLYTRGEAVALTSLGRVDERRTDLPDYLPQTTNQRPILLMWSRDVPPFSVTLSSFSGGFQVALEAYPNYVSVAASDVAEIHANSTLYAVDGTRVGASPVLAQALLDGRVGEAVELILLNGTEQEILNLRRRPVDRQTHPLRVDFWDDRTVLFTPTQPLGLGLYCLTSTVDWCFEIVTELDPVPTLPPEATDHTPEAGATMTTCADVTGTVTLATTRVRELPSMQAGVLTELTQGTAITAFGTNENGGYLYIRAETGVMGWVSRQAIRLDERFAELPTLTSGCRR